jgi:hypothetical protein
MHASREEHIAVNKSVLRNEEEVIIINSALFDFLMDMNLAKPTFVCLNVGEQMRGTRPICGQLLAQEDRQMTATPTSLAGLGTPREEVALSYIGDALLWWHTREIVNYDRHPDYKPPRQRVVVYPEFLDKLGVVLATRNLGIDQNDSKWPAYEAILSQSMTCGDNCRPMMLPDGDERFSQWPELARNSEEWMEDTKRVAVAGYRQVLEDGPEFCSSESEAGYSDRGEEYSIAEMLTPDMLDAKAKPMVARATLRARGMAGGQTTVSGKW